jgi:hypothetical protein
MELNRRKKMDSIAEQLNIQKQEDWYSVTVKQVRALGGTYLLDNYDNSTNSSLFEALKSVYPEYDWDPIHSNKHSASFWQDTKNQRRYMDWIAEQLDIQTQHDWYKITVKQVQQLGGSSALETHKNSLFMTLQSVYPEYKWNRLHSQEQRTLAMRELWQRVTPPKLLLAKVWNTDIDPTGTSFSHECSE